jgi:CHAT domain-containing protein
VPTPISLFWKSADKLVGTVLAVAVDIDDAGGAVARNGVLSAAAKHIAASMYGKALTAEAATPTSLLIYARRYRYLHIAAHGVEDGDSPAFHAIFLAPDVTGVRKVFAHQIAGLDLTSTSLVTLASCDSLLLRFDEDDNLVGLGRALFTAGVGCIVGALWPVTDQLSAAFFVALYDALALSSDVTAAFFSAQRSARAIYPEYRDWGAFMLMGRPRSEGR